MAASIFFSLQPGIAQLSGAASRSIDLGQLNEVEDAAEDFANALLDLSVEVRDGDPLLIVQHFSSEATVEAFPEMPAKLEPGVKWISGHSWSRSPELRGPNEIAKGWQRLFEHFHKIEDARFTVKTGRFDRRAGSGQAEIKFFLIGQARHGVVESMRGNAHARVARSDAGRWQIEWLRFEAVESQVSGTTLFSEVSQAAGVAVDLALLEDNPRALFNMWHGAATGDVNGDGDLDLVVTGDGRNYLYLNDGNGKFVEAAAAAGILKTGPATAPLLLDIDNDGDLDLFFSAIGRQMLFENRLIPDGRLHFRDISATSGVAVDCAGYSAAAADVDNNGLPDIYVACYNRMDRISVSNLRNASNGLPNLLFLNRGSGRFREVGKEAGVADSRWSLAAQFFDADSDGDQDLYVANDFGENALYLNQFKETGRLHFREVTQHAGLRAPGYGMGVSVGDYDNDGQIDLHATYMSSTAGNRILGRFSPPDLAREELTGLLIRAAGNRLYRGRRDGRFEDVTERAGSFPAGWAWGGGFIDFDNDGWQDLHSANGMFSGKEMKDG